MERNLSLSLSDSELDMMDVGYYPSDTLRAHSHFFAPHYRYSTPLLLAGSSSGSGSGSGATSPDPSTPTTPTSGASVAPPKRSFSTEKLILSASSDSSRYDNRDGLAHDLSFLATMPELCDVTFLVGEDRQPICGVRAILAARSRQVTGGGGIVVCHGSLACSLVCVRACAVYIYVCV